MLGSTCSVCCDSCPPCEGSTCCGAEYPRTVGVCCENVWRMPSTGTCCDGVWYATGTPGECCGGYWYADEDAGDCCGGVWYPAPEGVSAPDLSVQPFEPVSWEAAECPEGQIYARWGQFGQCCGCISNQVWDPRAGEGYPPPGAYVPTDSVLDDLCCDGCPGPLYLPYDAFGNNNGCRGTCCADTNCSRLLQSECAAGVHPTHPDATHYSWTASHVVNGQPCCQGDPCAVECCVGGGVVQLATFSVTGDVAEGSLWTLTFGATTFTYTATGSDTTTDDIAAGLALAVTAPFSATATGSTISITGPSAGTGTITPPVGPAQQPTSSQVQLLSTGACTALGGAQKTGANCPCQAGERCCETATSSGTLLTFTKPAAFAGTVRVTVTGTTTGPILVYDTPFGQDATPTKRCPFTHTFLLCDGTFNVSPLPCGGTFHRVDVEVCYEEEATSTETFNFQGCSGPVSLGACPTECATTLLYTGAGLTSSAAISMYRDSTIEANGSGPLVLTGNIAPVASCVETLTLTGSSTAANEISGSIGDSVSGLSVRKTGAGTWRLTGANSYSRRLRVLSGTVIVGSVVSGDNASPFGGSSGDDRVPVIGDPDASSGFATLLTTGTVDRAFYVAEGGGSQVVTLGGSGTGVARFEFGQPIRLGRDVTLQASGGGTVEFAGLWVDSFDGPFPAVGFTIGSAGNAGTVVLQNFLPNSTTGVNVSYGTLRLEYQDEFGGPIWYETPVTVGGTGTSVTLEMNGVDQPLSDLTLQGSGSDITGGILRLVDSPTVTLTGTGHEISSAVALDDDATFDGTGSLLISGVVSGGSGVTMDGSGTVSLSESNTYTGTTTINGGTLKAGGLTAFGTGDIVVNAGGTLDKNGYALANTITNNGGTVLN